MPTSRKRRLNAIPLPPDLSVVDAAVNIELGKSHSLTDLASKLKLVPRDAYQLRWLLFYLGFSVEDHCDVLDELAYLEERHVDTLCTILESADMSYVGKGGVARFFRAQIPWLRQNRRRHFPPTCLRSLLNFAFFGHAGGVTRACTVNEFSHMIGVHPDDPDWWRFALRGRYRVYTYEWAFHKTLEASTSERLRATFNERYGLLYAARAGYALDCFGLFYWRLEAHPQLPSLANKPNVEVPVNCLNSAYAIGGVPGFFGALILQLRVGNKAFSETPRAVIETMLDRGLALNDSGMESSVHRGVDRSKWVSAMLGCSKELIGELVKSIASENPHSALENPGSVVGTCQRSQTARDSVRADHLDLASATKALRNLHGDVEGMLMTDEMYHDIFFANVGSNVSRDKVIRSVQLPWTMFVSGKGNGSSVLGYFLRCFANYLNPNSHQDSSCVHSQELLSCVGTLMHVSFGDLFSGNTGSDQYSRKRENMWIEFERVAALTDYEVFMSHPWLQLNENGVVTFKPPHVAWVIAYLNFCVFAKDQPIINTVVGTLKAKALVPSTMQPQLSALRAMAERVWGTVRSPWTHPAVKRIVNERLHEEYIALITDIPREVSPPPWFDVNCWLRRLVGAHRWCLRAVERISKASAQPSIRCFLHLAIFRIIFGLCHAGRPTEDDGIDIRDNLLVPKDHHGNDILNELTGLPDFIVFKSPKVHHTKNRKEYKRVYHNDRNLALCPVMRIVHVMLTYFIPNNVTEGPLFRHYDFEEGGVKCGEPWQDEMFRRYLQRMFMAAGWDGQHPLPNHRSLRPSSCGWMCRVLKCSELELVKQHMGHASAGENLELYLRDQMTWARDKYGSVEGDPLADPKSDMRLRSCEACVNEDFTNRSEPLITWLKRRRDEESIPELWNMEV
ncbi:hypothetical protein CTAYLR_009411 [Chrysophaeum taylorii]|uniref:Uncharacterized protein n=1 Tax=Chrysophaeum taylorii TaxID=2483200 RepID=A0AAD7UIU2_9STRA|nr:hypothetical protein CTAYLR_009411 [Chrysophaeum taylorii]